MSRREHLLRGLMVRVSPPLGPISSASLMALPSGVLRPREGAPVGPNGSASGVEAIRTEPAALVRLIPVVRIVAGLQAVSEDRIGVGGQTKAIRLTRVAKR